MALPKVCGIETELGIVVRGAESNPVLASSLVVNAYVNGSAPRIAWDFDAEQPGNDARGFNLIDVMAPEVETHLVNAVLTNGARFYVDHAHPEISTPECRDPLEALVYDRAAEEIARDAMRAANALLPPEGEVVLYKNNSDGKGNSYGCHENYLMDREIPFGRIVSQITPHFVTRQIFCGAGKVGCELPGLEPGAVPFQISQRADFFEEEVGLETTLKRPIVNTRDEPHCDPQRYRRLHVIVGDANMSEVATLLKVGTTAIVLAMIEDDRLGTDVLLADPVRAIRAISHDPDLTRTVMLRSGQRMTALEIQWHLYAKARAYAQDCGLEAVGETIGFEILDRWEQVLGGLERNDPGLATTVDWIAKRRLVEGYRDRHGLAGDDPRLKALDLQYHDLRTERSLASRVGLETIVDPEDARRAMSDPPTTTRAYFRGRCLQRWPDEVVAANWDSMVFDVGREPLRRVPMMEPLRGTATHVARLIDESSTAAELVSRLGS
jgi:proteasome accessory factor PafA2